MHLNVAAVVVAGIAVFVFAAGYYVALAEPRRRLSSAAAAQRRRPSPWLMGLELGKSIVVAAVVAGLVSIGGITSLASAVVLAIVLWIAFPVVLLVGSVTQDNVPWKLGAIHAGDWLAKLVIISIIVSLWP